MSNSGVNTGFAKCFILFMAVVILLQGCLYLGLSIWGLTQETCPETATDISSNPFQYVVDLIYFISESCGANPTLSVPDVTQEVVLKVNWEKSYMVTNRTYIFMIVYAVISGLWVVASLLVIATICAPITRLVSAIVFWPWFLFVIAGSILDVVATGYHIHDIVRTTSAQETFDYIGVVIPDVGNGNGNANEQIKSFLETFDPYFITPAVIMTCISSRVVIIWLLNIFGTSFCLSLSRVLSSQREHHKKHKHHHHHHQNENVNTTAAITPSAAAAYNTTAAPTTTSTQPYENVAFRPAPLVIAQVQQQPQTQAQSPQQQQAQMLRPMSHTPVQSAYSPNAPNLTPEIVLIETKSPQQPNNNNNNNNFDETAYRKSDSHPDRLDYPPKTPTSPNQTMMSPSAPAPNPAQELSSASVLNNRYSTTPSANNAPQRASEELRGQLPWSYTNMLGGKPQVPRKPQAQNYPSIPEPDYNEEFADSRVSATTPDANNRLNDTQQGYSRW